MRRQSSREGCDVVSDWAACSAVTTATPHRSSGAPVGRNGWSGGEVCSGSPIAEPVPRRLVSVNLENTSRIRHCRSVCVFGQDGLRPLLIVINGFTSHWRRFVDGNTFPAIAVGRLEWSFRFLAGNYRKRAKQAISVQFGAILGLIGTFFHLIAQTMRRRSTPRSRLRRRRMAEFELAKPRIHPAERVVSKNTKALPSP